MPGPAPLTIPMGDGEVELDPATGRVTGLRHGGRDYVGGETGGLLQLAVPLPDHPGHTVRLDQHGVPEVSRDGEAVILAYHSLATDDVELPVRAVITLRPDEAGLVLRAVIMNDSEHGIPQLAFPQLLGLGGLDVSAESRVQLARHRILPYVELAQRVDDLWWVDHKSQCYFSYGSKEFAMKWLDFGDAAGGLTLYARDTRYTTQGLVLDKPSPTADTLELRWVHYPFIAPGESWDSGDYVLRSHDGDWYAGARAYADYARPTYPYRAPERIREALAIRSVWPAVRSSPPTFRFAELDRFAAEVADSSYGIGELVLWHWWLKNGLPMIIDERLGSEQELAEALARCAEQGVKVCLFVSHNIIRDTEESPPAWRHLNAAGQPVQDNWTYGFGMLPRFRAHFIATHAMQIAAPLSKGWREASLAEYAKIIELGGNSIMFDVFRAPPDPEFNPAADGRPDESGVRLIELAAAARNLIQAKDPEGCFAGEFAADTKVPFLDYTWEWINAYAIADSGPFRYVFPEFRLNANVGHPRAAVIAFMEGALLNLMPGGMRTAPLADHPELAAAVRRLAELRRTYLRYFTDGQFRFREGLTVTGAEGRSYSHGADLLLVVINPTDEPVTASVRIDPRSWGDPAGLRSAGIRHLAGRTERVDRFDLDHELAVDLPPDGLAVIELLPQDRADHDQEER